MDDVTDTEDSVAVVEADPTPQTSSPPSTSMVDVSTPTPDPSEPPAPPPSTPTPGEPNLDELIHSERSMSAAREAALEEGRISAIRERDETTRERRQRLAAAVAESDAAPAPVIRSVEQALRQLASDLTPDEIEPVLKVVRNARSTIEDAAFLIANQGWKNAIDQGFDNADDAKAFWAKAEALDPALDGTAILPMYAEHRALSTKAVRDADPEALLKSNSKLRAHLEAYGDTRFKAGRTQGQVDPAGEPTATGGGVQTSYRTLEALTKARAEGRIPDDQAFLKEQDRLLNIS